LLLDCIKNANNQPGFSNVTFTIASSPRQMLTTKLFTTHFVMVDLTGTYGSLEDQFLWRIRLI